MYSSTAPRGHFKPWAFLWMPEFTSAFRFIYPTLLVAAWDRAYLWDIPTCQLVQTITEIQCPGPGSPTLGNINYVELSERHVFICGTSTIRIFSRGSGEHVLDIPSIQTSYANRHYKILPDNHLHAMPGSILLPHETRSYFTPAMPEHRLIDEFVAGASLKAYICVSIEATSSAVHVSPCGRNLVAMLASSKLVVWYDFERVLRNEVKIHDIALSIRLGSSRISTKYLAFDNRRIAVATVSVIL